jgi:curved DNA-binding protein CbpA
VNLNSKYFDSIRIAPRKQRGVEGDANPREALKEKPALRRCEWAGCRSVGLHRAPRLGAQGAATQENQYRWFCADHIREFNQSYDYFKGMTDAEIAAFQRDALTGHRPTWGLGVNAAPGYNTGYGPRPRSAAGFRDAFGLFEDAARSRPEKPEPQRRAPRTLERQALQTLGLDDTASLNEIKSRYKELVKRHHPDANGGDRSAEERLRKVIQAYDYLRKSGFC